VRVDGDVIHLAVDTSRDHSLYNYKRRASLIAMGAMIENMTIAGRQFGVEVTTELAEAPDGLAVATLRLMPASAAHDPLFPAIARRCTNRKPYGREALAADAAAALRAAVPAGSGATLTLVDDRSAMRDVARGASLNDRLLLGWRPLHDAFFESVRWTEEEASATRDGLFVKTLELGPMERPFKAFRSWGFMRVANIAGASLTAPRHSFQTFMRSAAFVLVQADTVGPMACVQGGRAAQRTWIAATSIGFSAQPMMGMLCLLPYLGDRDFTLPASTRILITKAFELLQANLPLSNDRQPILMLRVGRAPAPSAVSLRREVRIKESPRQGKDQ
jgi:hypothetical protein